MKLDDSIDSCVQRVSSAMAIVIVASDDFITINNIIVFFTSELVHVTIEQAFDLALHQWEEKPKNLSVVSQVIPRLSSAHLFNSISVEKYTGPHARDDLNSC